MANYGLKIAKNGHDVSEADRYMKFTSKYPALKLKASGTGTMSHTGDDGSETVTISHGLGYVPICFVYGEWYNTTTEAVVARYNVWNRWIYQGLQVADTYYFYADTSNLYIKLGLCHLTDPFSFDLDYMYHIFYDEDDL